MRPISSRSCITLRTEAGDSDFGKVRESIREPTGSPLTRIGIDDAAENIARARIDLGEGAGVGGLLGIDGHDGNLTCAAELRKPR